MHIKFQHIISVIFLYLLIMIPFSQAKDLHTDFEDVYGIYEVERKKIIVKNLDLTEKEAQKFWPLYNTYRVQIKDEVKSIIGLLQALTKDMSGISNVKAENLVKRALELEAKHFKVYKEYILDIKSKSILSGTKLLRYYELEIGLIAAFKNNLNRIVPLVIIKKENTN